MDDVVGGGGSAQLEELVLQPDPSPKPIHLKHLKIDLIRKCL
jgi:hypothetical protein